MAKKKKSASNLLEVQNAAKTLFANIRFMSPDNPIRTMVMTSSVPNEGKSTCSIELARAIATSGKTVLLVEADMRRRTLADALNVRPPAGVYSVLTDAAPLSQAVVATSTPNMYFLDVEPNIPNPADIISSKRYAKLVTLLEENYDYVVFDTPPVGTFIDAAILSTLVDGTVMVVKPNSTKRTELLDACEQLKKADANILGICATFCEGTGSEYYYAYYTKDGGRVKHDGDVAALQSHPAPGRSARAQKAPQVGHGDARRNVAASQAANRAAYVSSNPTGKGRNGR